jgi:hypothetical protein
MSIARDFDTDEIVIRIPRGGKAGGFARFLEAAAEAIEHGKILPTNPAAANHVKVADELRRMAEKIHGHNDA